MTTFDERERAFEKKFALDQELRFKAESRRNRLLAEWAASKLGITDVTTYVREVQRADLVERGDDDVFRKLRADFDSKGVEMTDDEIRRAMGEFLAEAVRQVEADRKS